MLLFPVVFTKAIPPTHTHYRDNDFEVAKREYYSRRNSTVDDLRDQQQRVSEPPFSLLSSISFTFLFFSITSQISEVGLLTNFAVQARRASLPSAFLDGFVPPHHDDND